MGGLRWQLEYGPDILHLALVCYDYPGLKPTIEVQEGEGAQGDQLIFTDQKTKGIRCTVPGSGRIVAIKRGAKRVFESLVIELNNTQGVRFTR